jgi:protein-S-isoprenylcysteine O-methyltransferase Ste14
MPTDGTAILTPIKRPLAFDAADVLFYSSWRHPMQDPNQPPPPSEPLAYQSGSDQVAERRERNPLTLQRLVGSPWMPAGLVAVCAGIIWVLDPSGPSPLIVLVPILWLAGIWYILNRIRAEPPSLLRAGRSLAAVVCYVILIFLTQGYEFDAIVDEVTQYRTRALFDDNQWRRIYLLAAPPLIFGLLDLARLVQRMTPKAPSD